MPFNNGDKAFIKNVQQSKKCNFQWILTKFSKTNCKKRKTGHVIKKIWQTQSNDQKHESDRLTHAHNEENVTTVKELVAPLRHLK